MLPYQSKVTKYLFFLLLFIVLAYGVFEARNFLYGPQIHIATPANGLTSKTSVVEISGTVANVTEISLDGHLVPLDESGKFTERLILAPGVNTFDFVAKDKFGRVRHRKLQILYKASEQIKNINN